MSNFKFLTGDSNWQDYGGKWARKVGDGRYHVMELLNWHDAVGEDEAPATYNVNLSEIDLTAAPESALNDAYRYYGWDGTEGFLKTDEMKVECLHSYGHKAPLWDKNGNNYSKLMTECRAESAALDDPAAHEAAMNRPVNAAGSTAREFAQGDIYSAMTRGVREGRTASKLMAKMHGASDENIAAVAASKPKRVVAFNVNLTEVPNDDPLPYVTGYMHAMSGSGLSKPRGDLATAYIDGYHIGVEVKSGKAERPTWAR